MYGASICLRVLLYRGTASAASGVTNNMHSQWECISGRVDAAIPSAHFEYVSVFPLKPKFKPVQRDISGRKKNILTWFFQICKSATTFDQFRESAWVGCAMSISAKSCAPLPSITHLSPSLHAPHIRLTLHVLLARFPRQEVAHFQWNRDQRSEEQRLCPWQRRWPGSLDSL